MFSNIIDIDTVDISTIAKNEIFALDTNVLYWMHYSKASDPNLKSLPYQVSKYPNFVLKLLENGNTLVTTVLNISELIHVVENSEYRIYNTVTKCHIKKKDFRKLTIERENYKKELETIMLQLEASYGSQIKIVDVRKEFIRDYIHTMNTHLCDIFDYIIIKKLIKDGVTNFITDDKDFETVDDINLFTAYN